MKHEDWSGDRVSVYSTLAARNFAKNEREANDYYATEPKAARLLMGVENFAPNIWECACGEGHLSKEFEAAGYNVYSSDLIDRGYGEVRDFFTADMPCSDCDIITNPPYSKATEFVGRAMEIIQPGHKVAMFLKIQFLETQKRRSLFNKWPPKTVYVATHRLRCALNGDFASIGSSAVCYAWFVWQKGWRGDTVVKWIN